MPLHDVAAEAARVLEDAERDNVTLRLVGGLAIYLRCPSAQEPALKRSYADIDFVGHKNDAGPIKKLFMKLGYLPRERFNAVFGEERLIFHDMENMRRIDVFLDVFHMCHTFNLTDRLELEKRTLPLADLLATKLQVVEATEREYKDVICLLLDHDVGERDEPEVINGRYLAKLAANNWGIYTTFRKSLENISASLASFPLGEEEKTIVRSRIQRVAEQLDKEPKTMKWKARAAVGEKVVWYELPEQEQKIVA
jgi:hypothetical protein